MDINRKDLKPRHFCVISYATDYRHNFTVGQITGEALGLLLPAERLPDARNEFESRESAETVGARQPVRSGEEATEVLCLLPLLSKTAFSSFASSSVSRGVPGVISPPVLSPSGEAGWDGWLETKNRFLSHPTERCGCSLCNVVLRGEPLHGWRGKRTSTSAMLFRQPLKGKTIHVIT